jgi:O-acetylhomoserine (thiol)-lyase
LFTFEIKGGLAAGVRLVEGCKLFTHLISLGETHSLISHPASTTHRPLSEEQLMAAGITPGTVRLAIGLEAPEDLIADLEKALCKV